VTVHGAVHSSSSGAPGGRAAPPRPPSTSRREVLDLLRRFAVHVETAHVLDQRAGRCTSPHLAAVLRERAEARRRAAERIRAELVRRGVTVVRRRPADGDGGVGRR
jgi:hypothetical protein